MELLGLILICLALVFYFLPAIIANIRGTEHQTAIGLINFFLGWTVLGWLAALIWAIVEKPTELAPTVSLDNYEYIWEKQQREKMEAAARNRGQATIDRSRKDPAEEIILKPEADARWDFPPRR
jgi:Superinfection immunity protein